MLQRAVPSIWNLLAARHVVCWLPVQCMASSFHAGFSRSSLPQPDQRTQNMYWFCTERLQNSHVSLKSFEGRIMQAKICQSFKHFTWGSYISHSVVVQTSGCITRTSAPGMQGPHLMLLGWQTWLEDPIVPVYQGAEFCFPNSGSSMFWMECKCLVGREFISTRYFQLLVCSSSAMRKLFRQDLTRVWIVSCAMDSMFC